MKKSQLRKQFKTKRNELSEQEIALFSGQIIENVKTLPIWEKTSFHVFLTIESQKEVKTTALIDFLHQHEKQVVVPKIHKPENELINCRFLPSTILSTNEWGIPEPDFCRAVNPIKIDVIFIPLLISDEKGNRVGYGKGFYDKLLAQCKTETIKIGLNFFEPIESISDINPNDIPLNHLVTPNQIFTY